MGRLETQTNSAAILLCAEKQKLVDTFVDASYVFMELQGLQTQAVIDDDPDFARFDDLIHMARERKDNAKYSLLAHMDEHCC
jgi:hypothetical protein